MGLSELREKIDSLDIELQRLFEERMAICDEVAREKKRTNAPVLQGNREQQIIDAVRGRSSEGFEQSSVDFINSIMAISRGRQKKLLSNSVTIPSGNKVNAVIACGGSSSRMGFNKLLHEIDGRAVILRTIDAFDRLEEIEKIVLTASADIKTELERLISNEGYSTPVVIVEGGSTRQQSVANGVLATDEGCDYVCIHDGARPFITADIIRSCISDAKQTGCAVVCVPVKDTIKQAEDMVVTDTPARETLFAAQTPQIIAREIYLLSLESAKASGKEYTDDVSLCEAIGIMPRITNGSYDNIKLTTPEDIALAESIAKGR